MDKLENAVAKICADFKVSIDDPMFAVLKAVYDLSRPADEKLIAEQELRILTLKRELDQTQEGLGKAAATLNESIKKLEVFRFRRLLTIYFFIFGAGILASALVLGVSYHGPMDRFFKTNSVDYSFSDSSAGKAELKINGKQIKSVRRENEFLLLEFGK